MSAVCSQGVLVVPLERHRVRAGGPLVLNLLNLRKELPVDIARTALPLEREMEAEVRGIIVAVELCGREGRAGVTHGARERGRGVRATPLRNGSHNKDKRTLSL